MWITRNSNSAEQHRSVRCRWQFGNVNVISEFIKAYGCRQKWQSEVLEEMARGQKCLLEVVSLDLMVERIRRVTGMES